MATHNADLFDVVAVPKCGYGMRATRDLFQGRTILTEHPIVILRSAVLREGLDSLWPELRGLRKMWHEQKYWPDEVHVPQDVKDRFAELEYSKCSLQAQLQWMNLADAFSTSDAKTPGGVVRTNSFTDVSTGDNFLFERLSRVNHSCDPNMRFTLPHYHCDDNAVVLSMLRDAAKGEPLTISYMSRDDLDKSTAQRRTILRDRFNFVCECPRCGPASKHANQAAADDYVSGPEVIPKEGMMAREATGMMDPPDECRGRKYSQVAALDAAQTVLLRQLRALCVLLGKASTSDTPPPPAVFKAIGACADALSSTEAALHAMA